MKKAVEPVKDMIVLLSLHDITPPFEDDIVHTYDMLTNLGIDSLTLLVTPFYGMKKTSCFVKGSFFSEFLLSLNLEISLHGYSHFAKSGVLQEFSSLTTEKMITRLKDGIALIKQGFGLRPVGFVPPMWESPHRLIKAVRDVGLDYCVIENSINKSDDMRVFGTGSRIISQGQKTINTEAAMFEIELGGALQIGIHPSDHRMNNIFDLLADLKDRQGYRFFGYWEYLKSLH